MKLMTKNKAMEILGIGRTALENMLKAGQLKCVLVGNSYRIPQWSLEQCQKNTVDYPTNSSSEEVYTTSKYQPSSMDSGYSFAKARTLRTENKRKSTPQSDSHKLSMMPNLEPTQIN